MIPEFLTHFPHMEVSTEGARQGREWSVSRVLIYSYFCLSPEWPANYE